MICPYFQRITCRLPFDQILQTFWEISNQCSACHCKKWASIVNPKFELSDFEDLRRWSLQMTQSFSLFFIRHNTEVYEFSRVQNFPHNTFIIVSLKKVRSSTTSTWHSYWMLWSQKPSWHHLKLLTEGFRNVLFTFDWKMIWGSMIWSPVHNNAFLPIPVSLE